MNLARNIKADPWGRYETQARQSRQRRRLEAEAAGGCLEANCAQAQDTEGYEVSRYQRRSGYSKFGVRTDRKGVEDRTADNIVFHSKGECLRYQELRANLRAGIITDLKLQPRFPLIVNGQKICEYVADFSYMSLDGRPVIEEFKGMRTALFIVKSKLFHAVYPGLRIVEVR